MPFLNTIQAHLVAEVKGTLLKTILFEAIIALMLTKKARDGGQASFDPESTCEKISSAGLLPRDSFRKSRRCECHKNGLSASAPEYFRQPLEFLVESNYNRKHRLINRIVPMAIVLVQVSVTATFPAVLRHVPRAGFQDGLPYFD